MLFVTGTLGDSALALRLLQEGETPGVFLAERHHNPTARVAVARALAQSGLVHAMIDLSDGLLGDLHHLLTPVGLGARLEMAQLPLSAAFREAVARRPGWADLALTGGEDYELLFTTAADASASLISLGHAAGVPVTPIGQLTADNQGIRIYDAAGGEVAFQKQGFSHFS